MFNFFCNPEMNEYTISKPDSFFSTLHYQEISSLSKEKEKEGQSKILFKDLLPFLHFKKSLKYESHNDPNFFGSEFLCKTAQKDNKTQQHHA